VWGEKASAMVIAKGKTIKAQIKSTFENED
jgi:hypothetical protein